MTGRKLHYSGTYQRRAQLLRQRANANPDTRCWRCGRTLADHPPHKNGKPARWTAGHVIAGDPASDLLPEASTCNYRAGGAITPRHSDDGPRLSGVCGSGYDWP